MVNLSEQQLVDQAVRGDHGALGTLLESYQQRLYNVVLRMVGNRDDAIELTQDAMVKIVAHIGSFDGRASIRTWMTRIAMNLSISHLRKRRLRSAISLDSTAGQLGGDHQARALREQIQDHREPSPATGVQQEEMLDQLRIAIDRLDDTLRAVLVLRDIEEMDYGQISQVLELPLGTVKSRLFRARLALRREMYHVSPPGRGGESTPRAPAEEPTRHAESPSPVRETSLDDRPRETHTRPG